MAHRTAFHRLMIIQVFYRIKANSYILLYLPQAISEINQCLEEKGAKLQRPGLEICPYQSSTASHP